MRFLELFAGAGGLSLGLERAGLTCVGHAEIDPHARAVLRARWPEVPLYEDVQTLDGKALMQQHPFEVLSGGSPCQDLSHAGKRAGLAGTRSGLFFHQVRIWNESGAPYLLWENVAGALSSNKGADFAAVLSTIVGRDLIADGLVKPDRKGKYKWERGGVASGPTAVAAWRVFDLQYVGPGRIGVPQRRTRVFVLAARPGALDPAAVLALGESMCGHPPASRETPEDFARRAGEGAAGGRGVIPDAVFERHDQDARYKPIDVAPTLGSQADNGCDLPIALAFHENQHSDVSLSEVTTSVSGQGGKPGQGYKAVLQDVGHAFHCTQDPIPTDEGCTPALSANAYVGVTVQCATGDVTHALKAEGADGSEDGTGRGTPIVAIAFSAKNDGGDAGDVAPTLRAMNHDESHANGGGQVAVLFDARNVQASAELAHALQAKPNGGTSVNCQPVVFDVEVIGTLSDGAHHGGGLNGQDAYTGRIFADGPAPIQVMASGQSNAPIAEGVSPTLSCLHEAPIASSTVLRPRRLTPLECERLMAWPDDHTAEGIKEDGKHYQLTDSARYRIVGNGVGAPQAEWIGRRLLG